MNKLKKILALLMVAAFALMSVAFANDTENEENRVQPRSSEYFRSYSGSIVAKGNGRFNIVFNVTARSVMTKLGATSISVYKNGSYVYTIDYTDSGTFLRVTCPKAVADKAAGMLGMGEERRS